MKTIIQVLSLSVALLLFLVLEYSGITEKYILLGGIWSLYHFRHFASSIYSVFERVTRYEK